MYNGLSNSLATVIFTQWD